METVAGPGCWYPSQVPGGLARLCIRESFRTNGDDRVKSRILGCFVAMAVMAGMIGPVALPVSTNPSNLLVPARALAVGPLAVGLYYAWTDYASTKWGIRAQILVTDATPSSGSSDSVSVSVVMPNGGWLQTGWAKGETPIGNTGSSVWFYTEYCTQYGYYTCTGSYSWTNQGTATVGTTHTFAVVYSGCQVSCTEYRFYAMIDGVSKASVALQQSTGSLEAQAESHNSLDHMPQGHISSLQYYIPYGRGWAWFAWNGYGSHGANSPFTQTIVSNTEWYYTEN